MLLWLLPVTLLALLSLLGLASRSLPPTAA